ncbi:MAG: CDP-alcohol phosphatidyltransferase family protein, partial [Bacteroidota bacterium]
MDQKGEYSYAASVKSDVSDELINTYLLRPIAGLIVKLLYSTPITPNQVTVASIVSGLLAGLFYLGGNPVSVAAAGLLVTLKDILDSADGQLARAKNQYTRIGRFLDSIGDFVVDLAVFAAIGWTLYRSSRDITMLVWAFLGFIGITLRVSYHVFYHTSFLHLEKKYQMNRVAEEFTEDDLAGDKFTLALQKIFLVFYGWQDRLIAGVDRWCRRGQEGDEFL